MHKEKGRPKYHKFLLFRGTTDREMTESAYTAVESAMRYANQRRILTMVEDPRRRVPAKRKRTSYSMKLSRRRIWIAHSFQI
jgi:hypothetical protein